MHKRKRGITDGPFTETKELLGSPRANWMPEA
jgi:hypothetical protein